MKNKSVQKPLIIIEGPGKKDKFNEISSILFSATQVFATKGRLFDLPTNKMGVALKGNKINADWIPINNGLIESLKNAINKSTEVILATDNDDEGHLIAWQISKITEKFNKPVSRIILNELTGEAFLNAYENKQKCNHLMAEPALRRRIFDRLIGFNENKKNDWGSATLSRIRSPLSKIISEGNYSIGSIKIKTEGDWIIECPITANNQSLIDKTIRNINYEIEKYGSHINCDTSEIIESKQDDSLPSFTSLLSESSALLKLPVIDIHNATQELYEQGYISYPRTDVNQLHKSSAERIRALAAKDGIKFKIKTRNLISDTDKKNNIINHEAIHSIKTPSIAGQTCKYSTTIEKTHSFIHSKTMKSGEISRNKNKSLALNVAKKHIPWITSHLLNISKDISIYKNTDRDLNRINHVDSSKQFINKATFTKKSNDLIILDIISSQSLDRPSTIALHSDRLAKDFLDGDSRPTKKVAQTLSLTANIAPNLLKAENSLMISESFKNIETTSAAIISNCISFSKGDSSSIQTEFIEKRIDDTFLCEQGISI